MYLITTDRANEERDCTDALKQLEQAASDIGELVQTVDAFSEWWLQMDTMLNSVEAQVGELRADKIVKLRVITAQRGWGKVKSMYLEYKIKVSG